MSAYTFCMSPDPAVHDFPVLADGAYLDHAAVAPLPRACAEAMQNAAGAAMLGRHADAAWYRAAGRCRGLGAQLLGARGAHEVAFVPNTSTGLATLALAGFRGRGWLPGEEVVALADDFPANRLPWLALRKQGVRVRLIEPDANGLVTTRMVADAITRDTRLVAVPHVHYATGCRLDLRAIAEVADMVKAWVVVDAIQSLGAMPFEAAAWGVHAVAADGHKWMLGPEGAGLLWVHEDVVPQLPPPIVGWMQRERPLDFAAAHEIPQADARRFEPGTWNTIGLHGLAASLDLLLGVGLDEVWRRIDGLCLRLREGLAAQGAKVHSPRAPGQRSGIVSFTPRAGREPAAEAARLAARGIRINLRGGRLRASPHFYNTPAQVDALLAALAE